MKKETIKSDQDEPAKDPLTVKSIICLSKVFECINSKNVHWADRVRFLL